ncbi:MAG: sigma-54 dependent transcriptional regulator [Pirellulales bacterium]|nr:sigma-54 dependent transcriptional regulator [Pirellulales bacterium]
MVKDKHPSNSPQSREDNANIRLQDGTPSAAPLGGAESVRVLVIDNDDAHAKVVTESLTTVGYTCEMATSGETGKQRIETGDFDVVITDLRMNDVDGLGILAAANESLPDAEVILLTGHGTIQSAVEAMQQGAFNYLEKPIDIQQLRAVVDKASESRRLRGRIEELNRRLDEKFGFEGIIGSSGKMRDVIEMLKRVAPTDARVLITGENGTGKELVAKAIHQNSPRRKKQFYPMNCAGVVENVLDVQLFGSVAGIYTDARDKVGVFEFANGGTLFLDEIGDMPLVTQSKLLRVLETGEFTRVGGNETIKVNVRVLAATNQDLQQLIEDGRFRRDLYHRLRIVEVRLPSLRERPQDIPLLTEHFTKFFAKHHEKNIRKLTTAARRQLLAFDWPGNVRELRNAIERMVVVDYDEVLDVDDLPPELAVDVVPAEEGGEQANSLSLLVGQPMDEIEQMFIAETLKFTGGNREETAKMLGIGQRTLYRKIDKYGL